MRILFPKKEPMLSRREQWVLHLRKVAVDAELVIEPPKKIQVRQLELQFA